MLHRPLHTWEKRKENYIYLLYIFLIMGIDSIRDAVLLLKIPLPFLLKKRGGGRRSYEMTLFEDKRVKKSLYNFTVLKVYRITREIYFVYSDKMHIYNLKLWWSSMTEFSKSMLYLLWNHQRNKTSLGQFQIWSLVHQHSTMTLELELWQNFTSI